MAESKFQAETDVFLDRINAGDREGLWEMITHDEVEEKLLKRVERKAATYGQEVDNPNPEYRIKPAFVAELYKQWIIPLNKL